MSTEVNENNRYQAEMYANASQLNNLANALSFLGDATVNIYTNTPAQTPVSPLQNETVETIEEPQVIDQLANQEAVEHLPKS